MKPIALATVLCASALLNAQSPPFPLGRAQFLASNPGLTIPAGGKWDIGASSENVPAAGGGTVHSSKAVIAAYIEDDGTALPRLAVRRSIDGGRTFGMPQVLYTLAVGESLDGSQVTVAVTGHTAFVMMASGTILARTSGHNVLLFGSDDQGQTWTGPLQVNTGTATPNEPQYDVDEARMVASQGLCHCVWEADYVLPTNEDGFYSSIAMAGGALTVALPETRITNTALPGGFDVDTIRVAADGFNVVVAYRLNLAGWNDTYVRTSAASGFDLATRPEINLTNYTAGSGLDSPHPAISGGNVYVGFASSPRVTSGDDELFLAISNDLGASWNLANIFNAPGAGADADDPRLAASGSRIAVVWHDERNRLTGAGNSSNDVFIKVDNTAGAGLLAGTTPELQINTLSPPTVPGTSSGATLFAMEMVGDTIAVAIEDSWNNNSVTTRNGEDAVLCASIDGGVTWESVYISGVGSAFLAQGTEGDIDTPRLALTSNRDCAFIYASEALLGGTGPNEVMTSGIRLPYFVDDTANGNGLTLRSADSSFHGNPVAVLINATGVGPAFTLDPTTGVCLDLRLDAVTSVGLAIPAVFIAAPITPQGTLQFPAIPNLTALAGIPIGYQGVSFDLVRSRWVFTTDPAQF